MKPVSGYDDDHLWTGTDLARAKEDVHAWDRAVLVYEEWLYGHSVYLGFLLRSLIGVVPSLDADRCTRVLTSMETD